MRRRYSSLLIASLFMASVPFVHAAAFKPRMQEPKSFKDIIFGMKEVRENITNVNCGGWRDESSPPPEGEIAMSFPVFTCSPGINSCNGTTGFCSNQQPDGSIPICLSNVDAAGGGWDYLVLHELVHARQSALLGAGIPIPATKATCCANEEEAYSVQAAAMDADGLFNTPIHGITLTPESWAAFGVNNVSCSGYGPHPCSNDVFPPGFAQAYVDVFNQAPRRSCNDMTTNPSPRVQALIDEINAIPVHQGNQPPSFAGPVSLPLISDDVPGRKNLDPAGNPESGFGIRGNFEYPDSAFGFSSACDLTTDSMQDPDLARLGFNIVYDDVEVDADPNVRTKEGDGTIMLNPYGWCTTKEKASPRWCEKLFHTLQAMSTAIDAIRPTVDSVCSCDTDTVPNDCPDRPAKRFCFDPPYTFTCNGTSALQSSVETSSAIDPPFTDTPSQNTTCRTTWDRDFENQMTTCGAPEYTNDADGNPISAHIPVETQGTMRAISASFYRHYGGVFADWSQTKEKDRSTLEVHSPKDDWKLRIECYGQYHEVDPRRKVIDDTDRQCEIVILNDSEDDPKSPEWQEGTKKEKQKGVRPGKFVDDPTQEKRDKISPYEEVVEEESRDDRSVPEPWVEDDQTNLSVIDPEKLQERQQQTSDPFDLTDVASYLLEVKQRGSKTTPDDARSDAFSDDDHRGFIGFWEEQQRVLSKLTQEPTTVLIMPARSVTGLSLEDPLFRRVQGISPRSDGTVAITVHAGSDDIGALIDSFTRSTITPLEQVRIPLILPLASETELNGLLFEWRTWKDLEDRAASAEGRASFSSEADAVISKLQSYQQQARKARELRTVLPKLLQRIFKNQKDIREYMAQWYVQNLMTLDEVRQHAEQREELIQLWRDIQNILLETDASQLKWCSNQRYSLPIYSFLDSWWSEKDRGEDRDPNFRPPAEEDLTTLTIPTQRDVIYDFSALGFASGTSLKIPVLHPTFVPLKLPHPPAPGVRPQPSGDDMPELLPVPDTTIFDSFEIPDVQLPSVATITAPTPPDFTEAIEMLKKITTRIQAMSDLYRQFQESFLIPPDDEQREGNVAKIIHVENDLRERIQRGFARWMPLRPLDYQGRSERVDAMNPEPTCHEDVICLPLLGVDITSSEWQWYIPSFTSTFDDLRDTLKAATLPTSEDESAYAAPTVDVLRRLFPPLSLPIQFTLTPPPSRSR